MVEVLERNGELPLQCFSRKGRDRLGHFLHVLGTAAFRDHQNLFDHAAAVHVLRERRAREQQATEYGHEYQPEPNGPDARVRSITLPSRDGTA